MTNQTYSVEFPKTDFYKVYVEGKPGLTKAEVLALVKTSDLYEAELSNWDKTKDAYRHLTPGDKEVYNETTEKEVV